MAAPPVHGHARRQRRPVDQRTESRHSDGNGALETESELGLDSVSPADARRGSTTSSLEWICPARRNSCSTPAPGDGRRFRARARRAMVVVSGRRVPPVECAEHTVQPGSSGASSLASPEDAAADALGDWQGLRRRARTTWWSSSRWGPPSSSTSSVDQTTTASLLLMRSEAGWRVRDVLTGRSAP